MFNPEIVQKSEITSCIKEGCLSTRERVQMTRASIVTVKFFDISNQEKSIEFKDLDAHVVQHEIDHLDGIVISDFL
jgi:peptide deformylase